MVLCREGIVRIALIDRDIQRVEELCAPMQDGYYWACACVPSGRISADDYITFADIAERSETAPLDAVII